MQKLKVFFTILLTVMTLAHSTPSQAGVGKLIHNQKVVTAGLYVTAAGTAFAVGGAAGVQMTCSDLDCLATLIPLALGGMVALAGLITLDGEQELQFKALSKSEAMKIGATEDERLSFNSELDQANTLLAEVTSQVSAMENATVEDSARLWDEMKDFVSVATYTTMQKIVSQK